MIVAIQAVAGALSGRKAFEPGAIHQKDVGPSVVVVVEDRDAGSGGFDDVFLGVQATKDVLRGQAGFLGDIGEGRYESGWRRGRLGLLRAQCRRSKQKTAAGQRAANSIDRKGRRNLN